MITALLQRLLVGAALILAGCSSTTPRLDAHFGEAVVAARALQTINPGASLNSQVVIGLDGKAAADAMARYHESFKNPPPTFNVINIGSGNSGGN